MKKALPWLKWIVALVGLYVALHTSSLVRENYVLKDQMIHIAKTGNELSVEAKDSMREESIKDANLHLLIIVFGVLASGLWLGAPFAKPHNKSLNSTPKDGAN